ncbi:hypothetical protein [Amycolatopsis aidingensis]|uniref:hypothetical protein n=1 Tax=Amycolatopsis aidingensis TaxID=2842453 RepID=UPI001C0DE61F|nr:hypothetical protein [Amycolatopsis aidingensis]
MGRDPLYEARHEVGRLADEFRALTRAAPPFKVVESDAELLIWDTRSDLRLGVLDGPSCSSMANYLNLVHPYSGYALAELLWRIGGHGGGGDIVNAAQSLFISMGLASRPSTWRRRR